MTLNLENNCNIESIRTAWPEATDWSITKALAVEQELAKIGLQNKLKQNGVIFQ